MNEVISTVKQPLAKLEYMFLSKGIEKSEESFFEKYWELKHKSPNSFEICADKVIVKIQGNADSTETMTYTLEESIIAILNREINIIKDHISEAVAEITFNGKSPDLFLNVQAKGLEKIYREGYAKMKQYSFCVRMMNEIITHINSFLVNDKRYQLLESVGQGDNKSLIPELFDFLNTRKIINSDEYQDLLNLLDSFLDKYDVGRLKVNKKIDIKDENKILVRFCFYLLQKAQPKSRGTKQYFIDFMKKSFVNFEHDNSLSNHFSEPPKEKLDWHPDKVKEAMPQD